MRFIALGGAYWSSICGKSECFEGTRDALIQSGIAFDAAFPEGSKRKAWMCLSADGRLLSKEEAREDRKWRTPEQTRFLSTNKGRRGIYFMSVWRPWLYEQEIEKLKKQYKSEDHFRDEAGSRLIWAFEYSKQIIRGKQEQNVTGYRFSRENEILSMLDLLQQKVISSDVLIPEARQPVISVAPPRKIERRFTLITGGLTSHPMQ